MKNIRCLSFLTLKKHMTPLGNRELCKISLIWSSGDVCPFSFKTIYLIGN